MRNKTKKNIILLVLGVIFALSTIERRNIILIDDFSDTADNQSNKDENSEIVSNLKSAF